MPRRDNASALNYVESATYAAFGGLTGMVNGKATGFNGINIADTYNDRLQPLQMYVTTAIISPTVFLNQGNGSFQLAANTDPSSFMVSDLTGKGVVDLLGGTSNLEIWPNNGSLDFSSSPIAFSDPTANIEVADADTVGGGFAGVVSACRTSQCPGQIFYGDRTYQFTPVTVTNLDWPYIVGDFNGCSAYSARGQQKIRYEAEGTDAIGSVAGSIAQNRLSRIFRQPAHWHPDCNVRFGGIGCPLGRNQAGPKAFAKNSVSLRASL